MPDQSNRLAELETALADRDSQIAALKARVEKLEAANMELEGRAAADPEMAKELEEARATIKRLRPVAAHDKRSREQIERWKEFGEAAFKVGLDCLKGEPKKRNRAEIAELFRAHGFQFNRGKDGWNDTLLETFWKHLPKEYKNTQGGATRQG